MIDTATLYDQPTVQLLDGPNHATLVTLMPDGSPQASVLWFRRVGDEIRMVSYEAAQKTRNLMRNPKTTVVVDQGGDNYVEMRGEITIVHDTMAGQAELIELSARYMDPDEGRAYVESMGDKGWVIFSLTPARVRTRFID